MSDWVTWITRGVVDPPVKQMRGLPPMLTGGRDTREALAAAAILVIRQKSDGFFLHRYSTDGEPGGDTWHQSLDAAQQQANYEFCGHFAGWAGVPKEVSDPVQFAFNLWSQAQTGGL